MAYFHLHIETERLNIRPFTIDDVDDGYRMNLDEPVSKYTGDGGIVSKEEIRRRIKEDVLSDYKKYGYGRLAVCLKDTNEFIGFAGLKYLDDLKEVDLGYRFMSAYWGQGYATESARACVQLGFSDLSLNKIIAMVLPENTPSIRVLNKLHFKYQRDIVEDGLSAELYSLSKQDWHMHL